MQVLEDASSRPRDGAPLCFHSRQYPFTNWLLEKSKDQSETNGLELGLPSHCRLGEGTSKVTNSHLEGDSQTMSVNDVRTHELTHSELTVP